jgi:hypothetical protein
MRKPADGFLLHLPLVGPSRGSNYLILLGEDKHPDMYQNHQIFFASFGDILKRQNHAMKHT